MVLSELMCSILRSSLILGLQKWQRRAGAIHKAALIGLMVELK